MRYRFFKVLIGIIVCSWPLYPVAHILFKEGIITPYITASIYVAVDVFTKGLFTTVLLGSKEIHRNGTTLLGKLTKKVFKIHPLTHTMSETHMESIEEIIRITPFIPMTHPVLPTPSSPLPQNGSESEKRIAYINSVGISSTSSNKSNSANYVPTMASIQEESLT